MRDWAPPRHTWQTARASASAASAGRGGFASRRMRVIIAVTWALSARPLPVTAALTSLGVCSARGRPRLAAASMAIALACAVPMIVLTSPRAKTRSTAMASGAYRSTQSSSSIWRARRRSGTESDEGVRTTPTATIRRGAPTPPSTTPRPQRVSPGSTPNTRTTTSSAPVRPSAHARSSACVDNCSIDTVRGEAPGPDHRRATPTRADGRFPWGTARRSSTRRRSVARPRPGQPGPGRPAHSSSSSCAATSSETSPLT